MLHCYSNGIDTIVAESFDDLAIVAAGEVCDFNDPSEWGEYPDHEPLTIHFPDDTPPYSDTHSYGEWATLHGRGLLCSTEA